MNNKEVQCNRYQNIVSLPFLIILLLFSHVVYSVELIKEPPPRPPRPIVALRFSLLSLTRREAMISASITALRPFEISGGIVTHNKNNEEFQWSSRYKAMFAMAGYALPLNKLSKLAVDENKWEMLLLGGMYFERKKVQISDRNSSFLLYFAEKQAKAVALKMAFEMNEWVHEILGISLHFSLGMKYYLDEWDDVMLEPLLDVSLGIGFRVPGEKRLRE